MRNLPMPEINTEMKYFENHDAAIMIVFMLELGWGIEMQLYLINN